MNRKALLQLGAELLFEFRRGTMPADLALSEYFRSRKFLGAQDKTFLADTYYHVLRHLRRFDEAIGSSFSGTPVAEVRFSAGFPVTDANASQAWLSDKEIDLKQRVPDRLVDSIRLLVAAVELGLDKVDYLAGEIPHVWKQLPKKNEENATVYAEHSLVRMTERAVELAKSFQQPRRAVDEERAYSFPTWLWGLLSQSVPRGEHAALGQSLNEQAPVAVRVNTLKAKREQGEAALNEATIEFTHGEFSPDALLLRKRVSRARMPHTDDGWIEMQDEGSQLISMFCAPQPGWRCIDVCAGSGGKSLHLAALMGNKGVIHAFDAQHSRMRHLPRRAERAGATMIDMSMNLAKDGAPPPESALPPADLVLLDAPCTGTGTMRRNPEVKWRLSRTRMESLLDTQAKLLRMWAPRVKPGGYLVYATCSLLREENEDQAAAFLKDHPEFTTAPPEGFPVPLQEGHMRLFPHRQGCDGFFAARMQRRA